MTKFDPILEDQALEPTESGLTNEEKNILYPDKSKVDEGALGMSETNGITIDIHRETGLVVVNKKGIPDQKIELVAEDIEALWKFLNEHRDMIAKGGNET
mgnify:CR=1 FL=1